jgi:CHAT domain-containing protein
MNTRGLTIVVMLVAFVSTCTRPAGTDRQLQDLFHSARQSMWQGRLAEARTLADRGVALTRTRPDSQWSWRLRLLLCEILLNQLDIDQASPLLAESIPANPAFDEFRARQKYLHGKAQVAGGKLPAALASLQAVAVLAPASAEVQLDAKILEGQVRLRMGQWNEAETTLDAVLKQTEKTDRHRHALALNNLGMGRLIRSRYDEAVLRFEQVLSSSELERMAVYGTALYNAGICYSRLGEFDRALAMQRRAAEFHERNGPSRQLVEALGSLGTTYGLSGQHREALPFFQRALNAATTANLTADAALWAGNLATAHANLGNWNEAERFNEQAHRLGSTARSVKPVHFTLNAAEIASGRGNLAEAQKLYQEALAQSDGTAAVTWSAHAGLARAAMAARQPDLAFPHFEAALDTIERTRSNLLRTEFKLSFLTQLIEFYQAYVDALLDEGRIDRALEIVESSRGRVLAERHGVQTTHTVSAKTLRSLSQRTGTVLLSYWLAPNRSSLWIVDADGIRHVPLPPSKAIEDLVRQHQLMIHNSLANPLASVETPGDRLYELLIAPIASRIKPGSRVVIVPDGVLHRTNFETLPVAGERKHYWIEDAEIQIAPSLAMLTADREPDQPPGSILLIGDAISSDLEFPALRYASAEMANISRHFPPAAVTAHQKDRAVPGAYRNAQLDRYAMIHFTAHALANPQSPLDSAIMLSGAKQGFKLYARDIADHPLSAQLVTVSACRSAGERAYSGEGLVGFSWAFLRAGARRVIAGLWDVDDRSTADLMDQVYARIAAGAKPPQALREAKLAMLRGGSTYAKPYYWGPFEVFTVVIDPVDTGQSKVSSRKS